MQNNLPRVIVVGGGLAGMSASWRLAQTGFNVTLYESLTRLGGKAGSKLPQEVSWGTVSNGAGIVGQGAPNRANLFSDHGYHVFPRWYPNIHAVAQELNFDDKFRHSRRMATVRQPGTKRTITEYLESIRLLASVVDLVTRPDRHLRFLTLRGFLRSRWFNGSSPVTGIESFALKALATQSYDVSSMTTRQMMRQWISKLWRHDTWTSCKGSLQETLIEPIHQALAQAGVQILFQHSLTSVEFDGQSITRLGFTNHENGNAIEIETADHILVSALPPDVVQSFIDDRFYTIFPHLHDLKQIRSMSSAAMDIHFNRRMNLPGVDDAHFSLHHSEFGLTGIDISALWEDDELENSVIQLVAGDVGLLESLADDHFATCILNDFRKYFAFEDDDIDHWVLHRNETEPLTLNEVGTWYVRPEPHSGRISNLYLSGDYVRSDVDVASMEGAWVTGLNAAQAICDKYCPGGVIPKKKTNLLSRPTRWLLIVIRYVIGFVAWLTRGNGLAALLLLIAGVLLYFVGNYSWRD